MEEKIREQISNAIKHSGIKQTVLAEKLGVSQQLISAYLRGKKSPSLDTFARLCIVLGLDANDILGVR